MIFRTLLRRRAFTLIELLVVIAIVGLLATLVTAQLWGLKNRAKNAQIRLLVSQSGKNIEQFKIDHDGFVPSPDFADATAVLIGITGTYAFRITSQPPYGGPGDPLTKFFLANYGIDRPASKYAGTALGSTVYYYAVDCTTSSLVDAGGNSYYGLSGSGLYTFAATLIPEAGNSDAFTWVVNGTSASGPKVGGSVDSSVTLPAAGSATNTIGSCMTPIWR